jgi:gliding motility-associated-like protein
MKKLFLPLLLVANISFGQVDLNLGLKAYYPFTGNANDVSGNNNNPVFNNATLTADRVGNPNNAYHFDGSSSYMQVPNSASLNTTNKLSLSAWVKPMGFYAGNCHGNSIIAKGNTSTTPGLYIIWYDDNAGTNGANCGGPLNPAVENFYGAGGMAPAPGYTPYIQTNQWYSVIVTYDGTTVKLYIDCQLKYSGPQGGINFTNPQDLFIGKVDNPSFPYWVNGDIDEVRIYDRALTVDEVNVLGGCTTSSPSISNIINAYTPVLGLNPCSNGLTVEDATAFNTGDTVLLIQMKGAIIDSSNTAAFGTITDYKNAGNYEFNYVKSKAGNIIELEKKLTRQYDIPVGKVQLVRVPYFPNSVTISDTLTCLPWDGNKGGVLVLNVQDTINLNADINVSGRGFKGSQPITTIPGTGIFNQTDYAFPANAVHGTRKGEGIAEVSENLIFCRGPLGSGGGGGNSSNAGGGGGGNGGTGGRGGNEWGGSPIVLTNGGVGGNICTYSGTNNKIFMGGAGGAGHANDGSGTAGGNGGGIVIIKSGTIKPNTYKILSNGFQGPDCLNISVCADGVGGGGAGGTILINAQTITGNLPVQANGGKGADNNIPGPNVHAPGGGGGGGSLLVNSGSLLSNISFSSNGGVAGKALNHANTNWGAINGSNGISSTNFTIPFSSVPFQKNIDSVRIKDSLLNCNGFDFKGRAYFNTTAIASWQWYFGDGGQAATQNTSHAYTTAGTYTVRLIVTDLNGCMDSTFIDVNALAGVNAEAGGDTSICSGTAVSVMLNGTAVGGPYVWTPAIYLNNPNIQNPTATISSTTTFYLSVTGASACTSIDSVTVYINAPPLVNTISDTTICRFSPLVLNTVSNAASYQWSPAVYVSNPTIANPNYIDNFSHRVYVTGTSAAGCTAKDSVDVTVNPLPVVQTIADTTICIAANIILTTTGAQTYSWSPAAGLNNPGIANPVFNGVAGQTYIVTGTDGNGCKNTDQVTITISSPDSLKQPPSFTICQQQSVQLNGNNGTRVSYLWSPATYLSNAAIINPLANPPQTTLYTLLVTDNTCGFDSTFSTLLTVLPAPVISTGKSNDLDCALKSAILFATGGNQYLWSPSAGLSNITIANPVATPVNTQTYTVLVTNATGCTNTGSVTVFKNNTASLARYMPNAFTPNGDGKNDCYGLKNWMYVKQLQFYIFNRYGERVFATANPNICWDGTYKGKPALAGTYVYVIKAQTDCGMEEQKGSFILIR